MTTPRRNSLDLLRLVFASLVLLSHAAELIDGDRRRELLSVLTGGALSFGEFAVMGFFALSGFLIMASWRRNPSLVVFFRSRVLRIYPAFVVAFAISVLIVGPLGTGADRYFRQFGPLQFLLTMLSLRSPSWALSFDGQPYPLVNAALWTISYEFACYVCVGVLGFFAGARLCAVFLVLTVALLAAACFLPELRQVVAIRQLYEFIRLGSAFFVGASLCLLGFDGLNRKALVALAGALFAASLFSARFNTVGFAIFGTVFFLSIGLRAPQPGFMRRVPDISYGTYLYGWPIQKLLHWYLPDIDPWQLFALSLALALACGFLSWTFVESRFMKMKRAMLHATVAKAVEAP